MELLKSILGTFLRAVLASAGGWLIAKGYITEADWNALLTGGIMAAAALAWGVWQKYKSRLTFLAALDLPAGASEEEAKVKSSDPKIAARVFTIMFLATVLPLVAMQAGCSKVPGAKKAVYSAQTVAALDGLQDVIIVLDDAKVIGQSPKGFYSTHDQIAKSLEVLFARIQAGGYKKGDAIAAVEQILADVEKFEKDLDLIKDANAQGKLDNTIFALRFGLNSLKAVIAASKEPSPEELNQAVAKLRAPVRSPWWNDVILVVQNTFIRTFQQSRMTESEAWADAASIIAGIHRENAAKLAQ